MAHSQWMNDGRFCGRLQSALMHQELSRGGGEATLGFGSSLALALCGQVGPPKSQQSLPNRADRKTTNSRAIHWLSHVARKAKLGAHSAPSGRVRVELHTVGLHFWALRPRGPHCGNQSTADFDPLSPHPLSPLVMASSLGRPASQPASGNHLIARGRRQPEARPCTPPGRRASGRRPETRAPWLSRSKARKLATAAAGQTGRLINGRAGLLCIQLAASSLAPSWLRLR